jgi:hypothetical protein
VTTALGKPSFCEPVTNLNCNLHSLQSQNAKVAHLTSQLLASSSTSTPRLDEDEDELFAELEAEIENEDGTSREQGLKELQREYIDLCTRLTVLQITDNATAEWNV